MPLKSLSKRTATNIRRLDNTKHWDYQYGALVSAMPMMDLILIPFLPLYGYMKDPTRLNAALYYAGYLPVFVLWFFIYFVIELAISPMVYVVAMITKISSIMRKQSLRETIDLLVFTLFGYFIVIYNIFERIPAIQKALFET